MKRFKIGVALLLSFFACSATAGTLEVPADKPAITVEIPDSWLPEETDKGIACESPDQVATIFFEVAASERSMNTLIDENVDWLVKDQEVDINPATKVEKDFDVGGMKSSLLSYDANSKEFGPAKVGFIFTPINGKLLVTTYWLTVEGFDKHDATVNSILASVKSVK